MAPTPPDAEASPEPFRQITDHLAEVVWLVDAAFEEVRYVNPAYERLVGRPVADAGEGPVSLRAVHPDDREAFGAWLEAVREDLAADAVDDSYVVEVRVERADGEVRYVETTAVPVTDDAGDVTGVAGITTDLTERVERERALEETAQRLDRFASMVSHDLRNPLTVAMGRLELYRETGDEADLDGARDALERIESLTVELTALARHGEGEGGHEPVDLADVAEDAWQFVDTRSATLEAASAELLANRSQLQALFENLFRNAVGHGGDDVTVRTGPLDGGGFFVEDDGRGIPAEDRDRVLDHGFTTGYGGSGVGLAIVARIADLHDLAVTVAEGADGGARFEFVPTGETTAD